MQKMAIVCCAIAIFACSKKTTDSEFNSTVTMKLPWYNTDTKSYGLAPVTLNDLKSLTNLRGDWARFFYAPGMSEDQLTGKSPVTRYFKNSQGQFVPMDQTSAMTAVVYALIERLGKLDAKVGADGVNRFPKSIGVYVRAYSGGKEVHNNAFYHGKSDSILLVNYKGDEIPININPGIIAHEYFHSLFYNIINKQLLVRKNISFDFEPHGSSVDQLLGVKSPRLSSLSEAREKVASSEKMTPDAADSELTKTELRKAYMDTLLRGLNEGMADFWGWYFTGDVNFIAKSIPSQKENRTLEVNDADVYNLAYSKAGLRVQVESLLKTSSRSKLDLLDVVYDLAPRYSRILKYYSEQLQSFDGLSADEARLKVARGIIKSMQSMEGRIESLSEEALIGPSDFFLDLYNAMETKGSAAECELFEKALRSVKDEENPAAICKKNSAAKSERVEAKEATVKEFKLEIP